MPSETLSASKGTLDWIMTLPVTISRTDAARYAGCSLRHLDRVISRGDLLTIVHGRRRVVLRDSFQRWLLASLSGGAR